LRHALFILCTAASLSFAVVAPAAENEADIESAMQSGEIRPLEELIRSAKSRQPGKITEIELGHEDGRYVVEIDVLDDAGVKHELTLDAKTAEILSSEIDDDVESEAASGNSNDEDETAEAQCDDEDEDDEEDEG
jgi:uncharacterized membrane protein YkoI